MATSLKCGQCGVLLRSVAEAQNHNEVTGHTQFEESTEVIKVMVCTTCGKPCRTDAEMGLHKRMNPGHDNYKEQAADQQINTEVEMQEAQAALDDEVGLLKKALKPTAAGVDQPQASGSGAGSSAEPEELVPAEVDPGLLKEMEEMGFPTNRCIRALHFSKASDVETAVNWVVEHENDMDIDEPLLVPKGSNKPALSKEEARAKAEELMRKAKERREREEKERERQRELERIRAGKELQKAAEKEKEMAMKRMIEARQREKEEDARYREELRRRMEEDRKERRRKLGLPEELTEEEKAREAERLKKLAEEEAEKKKVFAVVKPVTTLAKMRDSAVAMKKACEGADERFKTAVATMGKYLANIAANPDEDKFRSIKLSNAAFQSRVAVVPGAVDFMVLAGFERDEEVLTMPRSKVNMEVINGAGGILNDALTNPFFGVL